MPDKQKNAKKSRKPKVSGHLHSGGGKVTLTELQKVLICNGGMAHSVLRGGKDRLRFATSPKRRGGKSAKETV